MTEMRDVRLPADLCAAVEKKFGTYVRQCGRTPGFCSARFVAR